MKRQSAAADSFWSRLRGAPRSVLMLDYDGTLAPFHKDRALAYPYAGVGERLALLALLPKVRLVVVSGRRAHEIPQLLNAPGKVEIWGSHGREHLKADGSYELLPLGDREREALEHVKQGIAQLGFAQAIESKPASLAIHWRGFEPAIEERIREAVESLHARYVLGSDLELLPFDGGLELRSNEHTKGTVVRQILAQEPPDIPVAYLGDDLTDEDAFEALGDHGLAILVRREPRESSAQYWIQPPEELLRFLDEWIEAASLPSSKRCDASSAGRETSSPGDSR